MKKNERDEVKPNIVTTAAKPLWAVAAASVVLSVPMVSVLALEAAAQERGAQEKAGPAGGERGNGPTDRGGMSRESGGGAERGQAIDPESRGKAGGAGQRTAGGQDGNATSRDKPEGRAKGAEEQPSRQQAGGKTEPDKAGDTKAERSNDRTKSSEKSSTGHDEPKKADSDKKADSEKPGGDAGQRDRAAQDAGKERDDKARAEGDKSRAEGDKNRAEGDKARTEDRAAEDKNQTDKSRDAANAPQLDDNARKTADRKVDEMKQKVTSNEREKARDAFTRTDVKRARDVDVRVNVGVPLPRSITLYDVPEDVVTVVPVYRDYRYVEVGDEICIVDPETYVIVDVISRGGRHASTGTSSGEGGRGARLVLTADQERFIREHVDHEHKADLKIRLTIGADVPGDIELHTFPESIISEVPAIREYRYVVVDEGVIIVDPGEKDVVYRIEG